MFNSLLFFVVFWVLFAIAFSLFAYRGYQLFSRLRLGKYENRFDSLAKRLVNTIGRILPQTCSLRSVSKKDLAGIGHALIFWGFLAFLLNYLIYIFIGNGLGLSELIEKTTFSQYFLLIVDIAGVFVALAIIWAAIRRYILKPARLEPTPEAAIILVLIFSLMVLHFSIEGFHINMTEDPLAIWTPVSLAFANFFNWLGLKPDLQAVLYPITWWLHYLIILGFLVFIVYSKHLHIMVSPLNIFFSSLKPKGALVPIDLEKAEIYGVSRIEQFTWKQLLDLYACTHCGRCQVNCPAYLTGKPLNPQKVILNLKEYLMEEGPALLKAKTTTAPPSRSLIGEVITEDILWSCTTCRACQEQCPALIEHIDKIIDMRRSLVLEQAKIPETAETILKCIEARGHSCRGTTFTRTDWTTGLEVKLLSEDSQVDLVYWVGCAAALEDRNIKVAIALARVLQTAGIKFGVLGPEETCCGEPARRMGNEYLFQLQAQKNIELLKNYNVKKLVTSCPHCFNTIKTEYPQFGGEFEVKHHSEFIAQLIREGRIKPITLLEKKMTYHDSCYLGRYNDIYEPPRQIIKAISASASKPLEMERNRKNGFCCGGGGGRFWMEERIGKRISEERIEEVIKTGTEVVVTACPYCLQMFEDAIKAKEAQETLKALDLAELVAEATLRSR